MCFSIDSPGVITTATFFTAFHLDLKRHLQWWSHCLICQCFLSLVSQIWQISQVLHTSTWLSSDMKCRKLDRQDCFGDHICLPPSRLPREHTREVDPRSQTLLPKCAHHPSRKQKGDSSAPNPQQRVTSKHKILRFLFSFAGFTKRQ